MKCDDDCVDSDADADADADGVKPDQIDGQELARDRAQAFLVSALASCSSKLLIISALPNYSHNQ